MGRVFAQSVLEANPEVSKFELVIIASKMHRMGLRPTLAECLRALENNEVDPKDIYEEIVSPTQPKPEEDEENQSQSRGGRAGSGKHFGRAVSTLCGATVQQHF